MINSLGVTDLKLSTTEHSDSDYILVAEGEKKNFNIPANAPSFDYMYANSKNIGFIAQHTLSELSGATPTKN